MMQSTEIPVIRLSRDAESAPVGPYIDLYRSPDDDSWFAKVCLPPYGNFSDEMVGALQKEANSLMTRMNQVREGSVKVPVEP